MNMGKWRNEAHMRSGCNEQNCRHESARVRENDAHLALRRELLVEVDELLVQLLRDLLKLVLATRDSRSRRKEGNSTLA